MEARPSGSSFFFFFFLATQRSAWDLPPRNESAQPPVLEAGSLNHWTTGKSRAVAFRVCQYIQSCRTATCARRCRVVSWWQSQKKRGTRRKAGQQTCVKSSLGRSWHPGAHKDSALQSLSAESIPAGPQVCQIRRLPSGQHSSASEGASPTQSLCAP